MKVNYITGNGIDENNQKLSDLLNFLKAKYGNVCVIALMGDFSQANIDWNINILWNNCSSIYYNLRTEALRPTSSKGPYVGVQGANHRCLRVSHADSPNVGSPSKIYLSDLIL